MPWFECMDKVEWTRDPAEVYTEWVAKVKSSIPADRLLVYNVKQGWEPLAKLLGKSVPNEPFPHANEGESMKSIGVFMYAVLDH